MGDALKNVHRDIVYSVCNGAGFTKGYLLAYPEAEEHARVLSYIANLWRSGGDTYDSWESIVENGFTQDRWRELTGPGHWNDPDMMLLGWLGWEEELRPTSLTPDEQYSHMSLWRLLSTPLFMGCDLTRLDDFTLSLLTNDEVTDINQDVLGKQGKQILLGVYSQAFVKELEDAAKAIGLFNLGSVKQKISIPWHLAGISGRQKVRDLWRQNDLGEFEDKFEAEVNPHGVVLIRLTPAK